MDDLEDGGLALRWAGDGSATLTADAWPGLRLAGLRPGLRVDGAEAPLAERAVETRDGTTTLTARAGGLALELCSAAHDGAVRLTGRLRNDDSVDHELDDLVLLGLPEGATDAALGADAAGTRLLEQGNYWGHVRPLGRAAEAGPAGGENDAAQAAVSGASDHVWVAAHAGEGGALLAGFLTSERWLGRIEVEAAADGALRRWRLGFDGAALRLPPGAELPLEEVVLLAGVDPWALLEAYGDRVAARHGLTVDGTPPVTWCSWYPYRLGVTEQRLVETGRLAARRLAPLGLTTVVADLGWQAGNLPSAFDENERFPRGLRWVADQLEALGLRLGAWCAPYSISAFDPVAAEHPEYLIQGEDGRPAAPGTWFWEPHGAVHVLDLTHPGARDWLHARLASLHARGVRYLKPDFIGTITRPEARRRHDRTITSGGGTEAGRIGGRIMQQALPGADILNCGGPEMPGTGAHRLLYSCNDTGNTGFISHAFRRRNTQSLACHLWKNRRWGIVQPSCLVVGGPGTLEEARLRATIAFLAGGQIDISDTLQSLPEDRWQVLAATLPPLGRSATPVDLFEPLPEVPFGYEDSTTGRGTPDQSLPDLPAGSVWHLRVDAGWDAWDLVGLFAQPDDLDTDSPGITRFRLPLERLGLAPAAAPTVFEFWSGQFLGAVPGGRTNPGGYTHPGDYQDLLCGTRPGVLDVAFFGPAAKLLCLRAARPHPWVAGTSFHQSCGVELEDVTWDADAGALSGRLRRPPGEAGRLLLTPAGRVAATAEVAGAPAPVLGAAGGSLSVPLVTVDEVTPWRVTFE